MAKKTNEQKEFEEFFSNQVAQENLFPDWNERSQRGNYKYFWVKVAFICWQESARRTADNHKG